MHFCRNTRCQRPLTTEIERIYELCESCMEQGKSFSDDVFTGVLKEERKSRKRWFE